jgi:hypothetical protein
MKRTAETLIAICDKIAAGTLSQANAARSCGVSESSYWFWIAQSQKGEPGFFVTYCGEEMPFHQAIGLARKIALQDIEGRFLERAHVGHLEPVFYQGRPQWKEREDLAGLDDETIAMLGHPDRYERDQFGNRIQLTIRHAPPVAAVIKVLESHMPRLYGQKSEVVNINRNSGVTTVEHRIAKLPAPAPVQVIGDQTEQDDLRELLGDPVEVEATVTEPSPPTPPPAEPVSAAEAYASTRPALTDLQRDLLSKLRTTGTAPRRAPVQVFRADDPDDLDPRRVGAGSPPTGGMKVR